MRQPLPVFGSRFTDAATIGEMLSINPNAITETNLPIEVVSCGVPFLFVPVSNLETVRKIKFRLDVWERVLRDFEASKVFVFTRETENSFADVHSRMFAPSSGIMEDSATGGASGPLGCYLARHKFFPGNPSIELTSEQGLEMGRPSFIKIKIEQADDEITGVRVGGNCCFIGSGYLELL
jgi:trans-2,3-dihydro-3-hydroxyanthranilate isomerase